VKRAKLNHAASARAVDTWRAGLYKRLHATVIDHSSPVSDLLRVSGQGDGQARDDLLPLVYAELPAEAARFSQRERLDHTLKPAHLLVGNSHTRPPCRARLALRRMPPGPTEVHGE
jgi:hypothetical protein